jgi:zinc/manganese transport system substrate-binding protein
MRMKKLVSTCVFLLGLAAWGGCSQNLTTAPLVLSDQPFPVVATYSILADWVQRVGGDRVQVTTLVGRDGDVHTYEPAPRDSVAIAGACLVFENGLHFESWMDKLYKSSRSRATRVAVARDITPRSQACSCHGTENDPHVWHSIKHAISMIKVIAAELSRIDPQSQEDYHRRAEEYIAQLAALDGDIRGRVQLIPEEQRQLFTIHDSFGYFAEEYGFKTCSLLDSFTSEAADPSAMKLASVIRRVKDSKVPAIFSENTLDGKLTEVVAREAGVNRIGSLYSDSLGPIDSPAADYLSMMRYNAETILESLQR